MCSIFLHCINVNNYACSQFPCLWREGPTFAPTNITILSIALVAIDVTPLVGTMTIVINDVQGGI
jgi:hypothetical protein